MDLDFWLVSTGLPACSTSGANAEGKTGKSAVSAGMRSPHTTVIPGSVALALADDVHDTLPLIAHSKFGNPQLLAI